MTSDSNKLAYNDDRQLATVIRGVIITDSDPSLRVLERTSNLAGRHTSVSPISPRKWIRQRRPAERKSAERMLTLRARIPRGDSLTLSTVSYLSTRIARGHSGTSPPYVPFETAEALAESTEWSGPSPFRKSFCRDEAAANYRDEVDSPSGIGAARVSRNCRVRVIVRALSARSVQRNP